jgi:Emfourin
MRIHFERSGGVGGVRLTAELDTDQGSAIYGAAQLQRSLSSDEVRRLREILEAVDLFDLPAQAPPSRRGADRFQYVVTVESAGKRHSMRTTDRAAPKALRALLEYLTKISMGRTTVSKSGGKPDDSARP